MLCTVEYSYENMEIKKNVPKIVYNAYCIQQIAKTYTTFEGM